MNSILVRYNLFKEPDSITLNVSGLDKVPQFLRETMLPNIAPETAAQASVTINGGYDPCQHDMVNNIHLWKLLIYLFDPSFRTVKLQLQQQQLQQQLDLLQ